MSSVSEDEFDVDPEELRKQLWPDNEAADAKAGARLKNELNADAYSGSTSTIGSTLTV